MADQPLTEQEVRDKLVRNLRWHSRDHRSNPYTELTANAADEIERLQQRLAEAERELAVARAALERIIPAFESALAGHSIRDADEVTAEALAALDREDT